MTRVIMAALLLVLAVHTARADQAAWVTKEQAEAAKNALFYYDALRIYCEPCGDEHWRPLVTEEIEVRPVGEGEYHEVVISGEAIDLAYTYFPRDGSYRNLALHLGIPVKGVSDTLDPWVTGPLPDFSATIFTGHIGEEEFILSFNNAEGALTGSVVFTAGNIRLNLDGTVDEFGQFTMVASMDGEETRAFEGVIAPEAIGIRGEVSTADGEDASSFEAYRAGRMVSQEAEITVGPLSATTRLSYPVLLANGAAEFFDSANALIAREVHNGAVSFAQDFAGVPSTHSLIPEAVHFGLHNQTWETIDFNLASLNNSVVSIAFLSYVYSGGAHGMSYYSALTLVPDDDGARPLALSELFAEQTDYWRLITEYCLTDLHEQGAYWVVQGSVTDIGEVEDATWTLSRGGITFYYDPYEMGPYAEGHYQVWMPFDAVEDILEPGMPGALFDGE